MKTPEEHFEDYKTAEAYDYPRGEVTTEGFVRYLARIVLEQEPFLDNPSPRSERP